MKRPIAVVLTIATSIAVAVCFLRPAGENTDFGNVPDVVGYGCFEQITDCTGDTDLLTIDAIDWSRSTDGTIVVRTTPTGLLSLTSQLLDSEGFALGEEDGRGTHGYAEKRVDNSWEYVGEIEIISFVKVLYSLDMSPTPDAYHDYVLNDSKNEWSFREFMVVLPEYKPGATYRINYFFRSQENDGWSNEVHAVAHTVTLPEKSDKQFDFVSMGWSRGGGKGFIPEVRVNYGKVPYLLLGACTLEQHENGQWIESLDRGGESAFRIFGDGPTDKLVPCYRTSDQYEVFGGHAYAHIDPEVNDYRLTLVFCDNADGSGERYTLTLYLNTELLAEYR